MIYTRTTNINGEIHTQRGKGGLGRGGRDGGRSYYPEKINHYWNHSMEENSEAFFDRQKNKIEREKGNDYWTMIIIWTLELGWGMLWG